MFRFGILGAAHIAPRALLEPAAELKKDVDVVAVAASSKDRAQAFAQQWGLEASQSYDELIAREDIDIIYNALPPSHHKDWSVKALAAGKHVFCEKPFALDAAQARVMVNTATQHHRYLIEAFHYRFHPLFNYLLQLIDENTIGKLQKIQANFEAYIPYHPDSLRHNPSLGGGALMDLGCYPIHWTRTLVGKEPQVVSATSIQSSEHVDLSMQAILTFPDGPCAEISCSMTDQLSNQQSSRLLIKGERGYIEAHNLIAPHLGNKLIVNTDHGRYERSFDIGTTYFYQLAYLISTLKGKTQPLTGGNDSIANMHLIDSIYNAAGMHSRGTSVREPLEA